MIFCDIAKRNHEYLLKTDYYATIIASTEHDNLYLKRRNFPEMKLSMTK